MPLSDETIKYLAHQTVSAAGTGLIEVLLDKNLDPTDDATWKPARRELMRAIAYEASLWAAI